MTIENDVSVGVLGEFRRGAGRPYKNLLGVWIGTGVGGGLILDGSLHGGRGAAGEIGHMVVKPNGRRCSCGRRGCLEAYAGRVSMERRARTTREARPEDESLPDHEEARPHAAELRCVRTGARTGRPRDEAADRRAAWATGLGLASAQNLLDLEAIIVGGGLGDRLGQPFVDQIVEQMTPHLFVPDEPPVVLRTELGDLVGRSRRSHACR